MLAWLPRQVCMVTAMVLGLSFNKSVITEAYLAGSCAGSSPSRLHLRADALVAQAGERHVVDLQVLQPGGGELGDLLTIGQRDVAPEFLNVRIGLRR